MIYFYVIVEKSVLVNILTLYLLVCIMLMVLYEVRGQLCGLGSPFPSKQGTQELNSGYQADVPGAPT